MQRRDVIFKALSTGVGLSLASTVSHAATATAQVIEAPENVQILHIADAGVVKKGSILVTLGSLDLDTAETQLNFYRDQVNIMSRPFSDGRIDAEVAMLKAKAIALKDILDANVIAASRESSFIFNHSDNEVIIHDINHLPPIDGQFKFLDFKDTVVNSSASTSEGSSTTTPVGAATPGTAQPTKGLSGDKTTTQGQSDAISHVVNPDYKDPTTVRAGLDKAKTDYLQARLDADQASLKKKDAEDKIKSIQTRIAQHADIISRRRALLQIRAPSDGVFTPRIANGSTAKRGHTLGELA